MPKSQVIDRDKGLKDLMKRLGDERWTLTVGVHSAEGGEVSRDGDGKQTVLDVAIINEYGLGVPERSFIRAWADENEQRNKAKLRKIAEAVFDGKYDIRTGLERLGLLFVGEIQTRIKAGISPPNAPSTIAKKKSSTPLINLGQLWTSILSKVTQGDRE